MLLLSLDDHLIRKHLSLSILEMAVLCDIVTISSATHFNLHTRSRNDMSDLLGISRSSVFRTLSKLEEKGYIGRDEHGASRHTQKLSEIVQSFKNSNPQ